MLIYLKELFYDILQAWVEFKFLRRKRKLFKDDDRWYEDDPEY